MKESRSLLSLLGFCIIAALGTSLAFASIVAGATLGFAGESGISGGGEDFREAAIQTSEPGTTFTGMITDSHCSARHLRMPNQNASECARACFRRGASYVLVDRDHRYTLVGGEQSLGKLAGGRATVIGTRQGDAILMGSAAPIL